MPLYFSHTSRWRCEVRRLRLCCPQINTETFGQRCREGHGWGGGTASASAFSEGVLSFSQTGRVTASSFKWQDLLFDPYQNTLLYLCIKSFHSALRLIYINRLENNSLIHIIIFYAVQLQVHHTMVDKKAGAHLHIPPTDNNLIIPFQTYEDIFLEGNKKKYRKDVSHVCFPFFQAEAIRWVALPLCANTSSHREVAERPFV